MKVHIKKIATYDFDEIYRFVKKLPLKDALAGKKTILLKPNLLGAFTPDRAVTTNPVIVDVVVTYLKEIGKDVILGDSPGGSTLVDHVWDKTGMKQIAEKHNVTLVNFTKGNINKKKSATMEFPISQYLWDVDAVVNLCKYKTHSLMSYTGAIKNLYGVIPGLKKSDYHKSYPDQKKFTTVITELYSIVKDRINFNILDGIVGMEGDGPSAGNPRNFGIVMASGSASALDYIASKMLGFKPDKLDYVISALKIDGIDPTEIDIDQQWQGFKFPKVKIKKIGLYVTIVKYTPKFLMRIFKKYFNYYPDFNDKCRQCNICVESCPMYVMELKVGADHPVIDYDKCIKCMCCHEMCPYQAIYIHKSFLAKFLIK
ncbi:MAG: DUF362 domain-containing protein [Candidatus Cloacimonetes bacterium]|nr:DUF362 domain-containing protein [Candidatus Cloacimonadota bacterium]